jgi:hypothetical protein
VNISLEKKKRAHNYYVQFGIISNKFGASIAINTISPSNLVAKKEEDSKKGNLS